MYPWILLESSPITHRRSPNCLCRKAEAQSQVSGINVVTPNHVMLPVIRLVTLYVRVYVWSLINVAFTCVILALEIS